MATMEDLEARVAALEASAADYRAVLTAVNALGANQREHSSRLNSVDTRLDGVERAVSDLHQQMRAGFRTADEHFAELRDLIVERHNGT